MSSIVFAIVFVVTSGGFFTKRFDKRPMMKALAALVAVISALYLIADVFDDASAFLNRGLAVAIDDEMQDTPPSKPVPSSDFMYSVEDSGESIVFVFPRLALDELLRNSQGGDLASSGFFVGISKGFSVSCTHWLNQGTNDASNFGLLDFPALIPHLQCNAWQEVEPGVSELIAQIDVISTFSTEKRELKLVLLDASSFRLARFKTTDSCVFTLSNQLSDYVVEQDVPC